MRINCEIIKRTQNAILIKQKDDQEKWIPLSAVNRITKYIDKTEIDIEDWICYKKNLETID